MVYDLECRNYIADAFPVINPNFGPGSIAAFLGLELRNGNDTVWFHQNEPVKKLSDIRFEFDPENPWFRRACDIYRAMAGRSEKLIHLGLTDIGGNLDIIASFRQSQELLLDLYDDPEEVERKGWEVHKVWWRYFEEFNRIIQDVHPGYTAWTPLYSETPYYMLQCDFSFMIGNDMFERFCLPEIEATCSRLSNPFFHLDGPGMLAHLDSLLAVPELKGIQWVPGAGQKEITEWPEVYRKIRAAGKRFQFFASQSSLGWRALEILTEQLGSTEGIMMYGEAPAADGPEINTMLKRLGMDRN
jgi:5-methyltetrahydrofolate--homocysteine methyltransferase